MTLPLVGLTGGIGAGKSTVAAAFSRLGVPVIDTDAISRALTARGGRAIPQVEQLFGARAIDPSGAMDRAYMRTLVFADAEKRKRLELILHPLIQSEVDAQRLAASTADYAILEVPLLFETGTYLAALFAVVVVDVPVETQIARVMQRSGLMRAEVEAIIGSQVSRELRLARADFVIDNGNNGGDLATLSRAVADVHAVLAQRAAAVSRAGANA